ncbi:MAG: nuclear transport factor 2 family protein [Nocardiopsaceae bacterium]|nr:nuclear transport factor 2 family protein [Nocardiopsaceae bacterium]
MSSPEETVQRFLDALADRDPEAAVALAAPDVTVTVFPLHIDGGGAPALRQVLDDLVRAFPDLLITVGKVIVTGEDVVTALFKAEGTQAADYAGAINQEKHLDIDQAWRFTVSDGRITEVRAYWCQAQLYRRLAVKRYDEIAIV